VRLRRIVSPQLANSLVVCGVALLATALVMELGHATPGAVSVGDIIAFEPEPGSISAGPAIPSGRIAVHRPGQFGCILDLDTLRRHGGSLVTEARIAAEGQTWRLHWAGARTAPDSADCGRSADLIVDNSDLNRLIKAAGGFTAGSIQPEGASAVSLLSP
jgi:hypothetical protein